MAVQPSYLRDCGCAHSFGASSCVRERTRAALLRRLQAMARGHLYIALNPSFAEGFLKIGMTTRSVAERAKELSVLQ